MTYIPKYCRLCSLFFALVLVYFAFGAQESLAARGNAGWTMVSNNGFDATCGSTRANVSANASQWNNDTPVNVDNISLIFTNKSTGAVVGSYSGISQAGPGCLNPCTGLLNIDVTGGVYSDFKGTYDYTSTCSSAKSNRLREKVYLKEKVLGNDYRAVSPISGDWLNYDPEFKIELLDFPASITTGGVTIPNNSIRSISLTDSLNGGAPVIFSREFSGGKGIYTFPKQGLANGQHLWSFYIFMGSAVNQIISGRTPSLWVGVDMLPPTIDSYSSVPVVPDEFSDVTLTAKATDNLSGLESISIYLDGELKETCVFANLTIQQTCSINVGKLAMGSHDFKVIATDHTKNPAGENSGNVVITNKNIVIPDTIPPAVAMTAPITGAGFTSAQTVAVAASSTDNVAVDRVEFYFKKDGGTGTLLGTATSTSSDFGIDWPVGIADNGTYSIYAKSFDASGNSATSTAVSVTVNIAAPDTPPQVAMVSPPAGANFTVAQTITVAASSTDNIGVTEVKFYYEKDGGAETLLGTATSTTNQFSVNWPVGSGNNGSYSLFAVSYDTAGNSTKSNEIAITVNIPIVDAVPPQVAMTAPANNTEFTTAHTVTVAASSTDDVAVREVNFYFKKDGGAETLLGTATSTTNLYEIGWPVAAADNGVYSLYARSFDTSGNSATSTAVSATVNIGAGGNKPEIILNAPEMFPPCTVSYPAFNLSWNYSDIYPQDAYVIQIDENGGNFSSPVVNYECSGGCNGTSWATRQIDNIEFNSTIYKWRVRVTNSHNKKSNWEEGAPFTTLAHAYPIPKFTFSPKVIFTDAPVTFTDTTVAFGGAQSWAWTFENGSTTDANVQNPVATFAAKGARKVALEVTDSDGHSCRVEKNLSIKRRLPEWKEI